MSRVEITYYCDTCGNSETVDATFGDSTEDDRIIPVGWGLDDEAQMLCEEHYSAYEDRLEAEIEAERAEA